MYFKVSLSDPLEEGAKSLGEFKAYQVIETFDGIHWKVFLDKMDAADESRIVQSPHFNVDDPERNACLSLAFIDEENWLIFFIRPERKKFLGLFDLGEKEYMNDIPGTHAEARECLKAFVNNDLESLRKKIP